LHKLDVAQLLQYWV